MDKSFKPAGWVFLTLVSLVLGAAIFAASPPGLINYQGVLRNASGAPLTGSYDMTFTFYSADSGGDQILVDTHAGGSQVGVAGGLFTTALGGGTVTDGTGPGTYTSLGNAFRDYGTAYLEIVVGGETLDQRVRLVSSAYSLNADNLDGLDSASFSLNSHNHTGTYLPLAGGTMAGNIAFSGAQTVDGVDLSASAPDWNSAYSHSTTTSNAHGLTYTAEGTGGGLDADLLDGQHASAFATGGHVHSTLTRGTGLSGSNYDGSAPTTFAVAYGTASGTAVQGDQTATITAGNGLSGGVSANALGDGFSATLDVGAGSGIFVSPNAVMLGPLTDDWDQTGKYDIVLNHADSNLRFLESSGATFFGALDVGDLSANATYTFGGASGTVWTSGNDGAGSTLDADLLDGQHASAFMSSGTTHGGLSGLANDDHPQYFALSQSETVSGIPAFNGGTSGTSAPFTVDSYTTVTSLSADYLDGYTEAAFFRLATNETVTGVPAFNGGTSGSEAPFSVDSTYLVTNLNADLLDGQHASSFGDGYSLDADDGSPADVVYVDASGNVGIGTTTPGAGRKLTVNATEGADTASGIFSYASNGVFQTYGIQAAADNRSQAGPSNAGVYGGSFQSYTSLDGGVGTSQAVLGQAYMFGSGGAYGVRGYATNDGTGYAYGIYGEAAAVTAGRAYAGYFDGKVFITGGNLSVSSGNLGIGTDPIYRLQVSTDSAAKPSTNTWTISSDARLKKDVEPFTDGLDVVREIKPIHYKYNGLAGTPKDAEGIGVIAQEIREVAPYTVGTFRAKLDEKAESETELLDFNSHALTFVIINAIKELDAKIGGASAPWVEKGDAGMIESARVRPSAHSPTTRGSTDGAASSTQAAHGHRFFEEMAVAGPVELGDVLVMIPSNGDELYRCALPADGAAVGITGDVIQQGSDGSPRMVAVVLGGVTFCKVDAGHGSIRKGDLLVTSPTPGHAMKAQPKLVDGVPIYATGTVVGKALEPLESGIGLIKVLVMLR